VHLDGFADIGLFAGSDGDVGDFHLATCRRQGAENKQQKQAAQSLHGVLMEIDSLVGLGVTGRAASMRQQDGRRRQQV